MNRLPADLADAAIPHPCERPDPSEADHLVCALISQSIQPDNYGSYFSGSIGIYAEALRHCCRVGLMVPCAGYESIESGGRDFSASMITTAQIIAHDPATCWHCQKDPAIKKLKVMTDEVTAAEIERIENGPMPWAGARPDSDESWEASHALKGGTEV